MVFDIALGVFMVLVCIGAIVLCWWLQHSPDDKEDTDNSTK